MAVTSSLKHVAGKIGGAIRGFAAGEHLDQDEIAIAGLFDERTGVIYLVVGSFRPIDERRWHAAIRSAIRKQFEDAPGLSSRLVLVVKNVNRVEQIDRELVIGDDDTDISEML